MCIAELLASKRCVLRSPPHTCSLRDASWFKHFYTKPFRSHKSYKTKVFMTGLVSKRHKQHPETAIHSHSSQLKTNGIFGCEKNHKTSAGTSKGHFRQSLQHWRVWQDGKANEKFKVPRVMLSMEKGHCSGTRFPLAQRVPFWVSCGYPTCHPALWIVCISGGVCDPSEVPVACHQASVSRLEVAD